MVQTLFSDYPNHVLAAFKQFHRENPHIYRAFKSLSFKMLKTGRVKYSARTIFEVMRWNSDLETNDSEFKINGNFIPIYSRLLVFNHPQFSEFFEFRKVRSKGVHFDKERQATSSVC